MRPILCISVLLLCLPLGALADADCDVRDLMTLPLPVTDDPVRTALELAYPGSRIDPETGSFTAPDGDVIPYAVARDIGPAARLDGATIGDMFTYTYPLAFDLIARQTPWADPGRLRNEAFFHALYGDTEQQARATLVRVTYQGQTISTPFDVTTAHCVASQLTAALDDMAGLSPGIDVFFDHAGGSFNWRTIAGTNRLSSHSFGAAIDLNSELGGYWRWSGRPEGDAGPYDNRFPPELVGIFERYGFIWGGKWHHFDGMHFEYRPELILFARLTGG